MADRIIGVTFTNAKPEEFEQDLSLGIPPGTIYGLEVHDWGKIQLRYWSGHFMATFRFNDVRTEVFKQKVVEGSGESAREAYVELRGEIAELGRTHSVCVDKVLTDIQWILQKNEESAKEQRKYPPNRD